MNGWLCESKSSRFLRKNKHIAVSLLYYIHFVLSGISGETLQWNVIASIQNWNQAHHRQMCCFPKRLYNQSSGILGQLQIITPWDLVCRTELRTWLVHAASSSLLIVSKCLLVSKKRKWLLLNIRVLQQPAVSWRRSCSLFLTPPKHTRLPSWNYCSWRLLGLTLR